uniref:Uncharacterized protein n=1 Tax=viral metagenome TaxID=1070528 RepID=A0A6H1ZLT9_9ZZZZ
MSELLSVVISVIYSDVTECVGFKGEMRTPKEAAEIAANEIRNRIIKKIPFDKVCSLVIGEKNSA